MPQPSTETTTIADCGCWAPDNCASAGLCYATGKPLAGTHGSPELDEDARKLQALGADPGPTISDIASPDRVI